MVRRQFARFMEMNKKKKEEAKTNMEEEHNATAVGSEQEKVRGNVCSSFSCCSLM